MNEEDAFALAQQYISGWRQNNIHMITCCLASNCVVIESHGPTYRGIPAIKRWFELWLEADSTVLKWNVLSFNFFEQKQIAFCEWDFACVSNNIKYALPGISVIKFSAQKIIFIQEYRMTHPAYEWSGDKLKSD